MCEREGRTRRGGGGASLSSSSADFDLVADYQAEQAHLVNETSRIRKKRETDERAVGKKRRQREVKRSVGEVLRRTRKPKKKKRKMEEKRYGGSESHTGAKVFDEMLS